MCDQLCVVIIQREHKVIDEGLESQAINHTGKSGWATGESVCHFYTYFTVTKTGLYLFSITVFGENPDIDNVAERAEAPGTGETLIPLLWALSTSTLPGSDIPGVPLFEIRAIFCPP